MVVSYSCKSCQEWKTWSYNYTSRVLNSEKNCYNPSTHAIILGFLHVRSDLLSQLRNVKTQEHTSPLGRLFDFISRNSIVQRQECEYS